MNDWTTAPSHGLRWAYVGGPADDARDLMRVIDYVAVFFPVTAVALGLQESILQWADLFGIKDQVQDIVWVLRAASGANEVATSALVWSSINVESGIAAVGSLAAALPVAGAVAAVVLSLSGGDDEEKQKARRKRIQAQVQHLRVRLSLKDFAGEQRSAAADAR